MRKDRSSVKKYDEEYEMPARVNIFLIVLYLFTIVLIIFSFVLIKNHFTTQDHVKELNIILKGYIEEQREFNILLEDMLVNTNFYLGQMVTEERIIHQETPSNKIDTRTYTEFKTTTQIEGDLSREQKSDILLSIVSIFSGDNLGSGFIVGEEGYILTKYDLLKQKKIVEVDIYNRTVPLADLEEYDAENNLALIKVDGLNLPTLEISRSANIDEGDQVAILGHPLGVGISLSHGKVIKIDKKSFQISAPGVNKGNIGGPVTNYDGEVIGMIMASDGEIHTAIYSTQMHSILKSFQ